MRTLLLLIAAVSWAAAVRTGEQIKAFIPNREYRYDYESQILTGIPAMSSQYSGLKIKARAIVHVESDKYVAVKLTGIEVFRVKEEPGVVPTTWVSSACLEPVPVEHSTELIESLVIPIKFRYENGIVTKVYAVAVDPYWSVNIKRGIISLMNLDLNIENPAPVASDVMQPFMEVISSDYNTMSAKTAYKVIEPSILGDCETWYSVVPIPSVSKMMVSKVVDTKRCSPKIMAEWGVFAGMLSGRNVREMDQLIQNSISVDYELSGTRHEFMIKSAVLTGKYIFAPIFDSLSSMDGYVMQKLTYVKDEAIGRRIVFESAPVPLMSGLHAYIPAQSVVVMETINNMRTTGSRMASAKIEMVDKLLEAIVEKTVNKVEKEVPDMIETVVSILRTLSKEEIMEIIMRYSAADVSGAGSVIAKKRSIVMDVLPTLPHPEVPLILIRLVKEGHISGVYAAALINVATLAATPSPVVINQLVEMIKDSGIIAQPVVHRAIILGVGVLSNKLVILHAKMAIPRRTTSVLIKNAVREMKAAMESGDVDIKVAVIKAIGNAGIVDFFPDVERMIKDKSQPIMVREQAIFAMRKMAAVTPMSIRSVLLPVYMDPMEPQMVRVAAFLLIMETRPGFGTIQMIGHSLNTEPSVQVASFAYSYLQNMARTSAPDLRPMAIIVRRVLMMVRPVIVSPVFNSRSIDAGIFTKYAGMGMELDKINAVNRALPMAMVDRIYMFVFGRRINIAEVGVEMHGVDEILRKLVGMKGVLADILMGRKDLSSIMDPLTAMDFGKVAAEIKKILAQTDLPIREADIMKFMAYFKVFGHELNFISMNKEMVADFIRSMQSSSQHGILDALLAGYNVDIVKAVPIVDNALILPTPIGLPITLNISAIAAIAVKGQVKVDGITSIRDIISSPRKLSIAVDVRPSAHIKVYQTIGIHHDIIQMGATVKRIVAADLPMSFAVDIDRASEMIAVKIGVPKMVAPSVFVRNSPELFYRYVPLKISSYGASMYEIHMPRAIPIVCGAVFKSIPISMAYEVPVVFMKAKISGMVSYPMPSFYDPVMMSMGPQEIAIALEPAYGTPEAVKFEVMYGARKMARSDDGGSWFSWFNEADVAESAVAGDEFVPVSVSSKIGAPITRQWFINVYTVGGYHDARIKSKLTMIYDASWMTYQINYQAVGSQVVASGWKVKMETLIHVPRFIRAVLRNPELSANDVISSTDISFGVDSFTENTVVIKIMPAYLSIKPEFDVPVNYFRNISIKAVVYYSRLASNVKANLMYAVKMLQPWIMPYVSQIRPASVASEMDNMEVILEVFPQIRKVNVIVATPVTTFYFDDIMVPMIWPFVQPIVPPTVRLAVLPLLPEITTLTAAPVDIPSAFYGVCRVTPTDITTLANNMMPLPEIAPTCEIVLAHDSSAQKLYTVVSSPVTAAGARTIRVIVPFVMVEVTNSLMADGPVIMVNGEMRPVPLREPIVVSRSMDGKVCKMVEIAVIGRKLVVRAVQVGVVVEVDGLSVAVMVSPLLMSAVSGMCSWVPRVPIMNPWVAAVGVSPFSAMAPPVRSFVVKSEHCPANGMMPSIMTSTCQMMERNIRITRVSEGIEQVCFSVEPLPACSGFCAPANSVSKMVGFHCMPASEVAGTAFAVDAFADMRSEMANKVVHTYQAVLVPTQCVA